MGKRTRDEVIYSRVDYRVKQEFESQMKESGYKTSERSEGAGGNVGIFWRTVQEPGLDTLCP